MPLKFRSLCFVNGQWIPSSDGKTFAVINPASGTVIENVPLLTSADVDHTIISAQESFISWSTLPARKRSDLLLALAHEIQKSSEELAQIITSEQGKPLAEARGEVAYAANYFRWFSEEAVRVHGDIIPADSPTKRILVLKQPIGVIAAITPWNFPLAMLGRKMSAALAAGCTVIAKPAPETPLAALALAEFCEKVGFPPGVVNVVTGDAEMIAQRLMRSPLVRKITFTGSTDVGKSLIRQSADTVKKLTLELGGNAPFVVCDDADLEKAVTGAIFGKYRNAGQTCICVNRFLVHESIAEDFTNLLLEQSKKLVVGDGKDPKTDVGPLISQQAFTKVSTIVASAEQEGATIALAPRKHPLGHLFFTPTVITDVTPNMSIWNQEIFGPVSAITTFRSDNEAIRLANSTSYGLAAYVYSTNLARAMEISERIEFGMVGINDTSISTVQAPFGGVKESGFGREGSRYGIDEYLVMKYVSLQL